MQPTLPNITEVIATSRGKIRVYMALQHKRFVLYNCYQLYMWALTSHFHYDPITPRRDKATWFSVTLSVILLFLKIYPPFQVANYSALPGLSSLKIKSDETNLFFIKIRINATFLQFFISIIFIELTVNDITYKTM